MAELLREAFLIGFPSPTLLDLLCEPDCDIEADGEYRRTVREEVARQKVMPVFKMVDTGAGEFESRTPYYYGTFEQEDGAVMAESAP